MAILYCMSHKDYVSFYLIQYIYTVEVRTCIRGSGAGQRVGATLVMTV